MPAEKNQVDIAKEASQLAQDLSQEVYYLLNLSIILSEASQFDRDAVRRIVNRAKQAREGLKTKKKETR